MHNTSTKYKQIISWNDNWILIFICFMDRILLEPSSSSSYSFMTSSFLIQILRWIRGSSSVESFIFLIAWGIFLGWWELDIQLLPFSLLLLWVELLLLFTLPESAEGNHFLLVPIPRMNKSHDPRRPFKVVITISYSSSIASSEHQTLPFGVLKDDTWGLRWYLIEFAMILLALALSSSPSRSLNFLTEIMI